MNIIKVSKIFYKYGIHYRYACLKLKIIDNEYYLYNNNTNVNILLNDNTNIPYSILKYCKQ